MVVLYIYIGPCRPKFSCIIFRCCDYNYDVSWLFLIIIIVFIHVEVVHVVVVHIVFIHVVVAFIHVVVVVTLVVDIYTCCGCIYFIR